MLLCSAVCQVRDLLDWLLREMGWGACGLDVDWVFVFWGCWCLTGILFQVRVER